MYREIKHEGLLLAVIGNAEDIPEGKMFRGDGNSPLEWGTFKLAANVALQPHIHKLRKRILSHKTIEFIYVVQGSLQLDFYSADKKKVTSEVLGTGDFVCLYDGGHGFKVLRDDTKFIEVKNGPFVGVSEDKEKF